MGNFSYLIQKKFRDLNSEQQRIFISEFERRKKSVGISYLLWFLLGWHYAYLKKWGWLILYILTVGGFFIWAIIDLFRIPKMVEQYNNDLALEILRDISIMFPDEGRTSDDKDVNKKVVNDLYITQKTESGESYSFYMMVGIIILFSVSTFLLKPDRATMQNEIADKILLQQPQIFKKMKDFFLGEKSPEEYSQNYIINTLSRKGYSNVGIYEEDLVLVRKLKYHNEDSDKDLITAYGFLGFTRVIFEYESVMEKSNSQSQRVGENTTFDFKKRDNAKGNYIPGKNTNYYERLSKTKNKVEDNYKEKPATVVSDLQEDSIKIN